MRFSKVQHCCSGSARSEYCHHCLSWRQNWDILEYLWTVHSWWDNGYAHLLAYLPSTHGRANVRGNVYSEGWGKMKVQGRFCMFVCGAGWYLAKHLKVNCKIKEYPSKVHASSAHRFIIITEFTLTFFLYPATYLSCFRLKYMSC